MYEYGCRNTVIRGLDAALDQMERRVRLWNRFVEIEKGIRQRARELLTVYPEYQEIKELQQRVTSLRAMIVQRRRTEGRNAPGIEDLKRQVLASRGALATLRQRADLNKKERFIRCKSALKALHEQRVQQAKQAEHESGLYWCNYGDVRQSYEVARVRAMRASTELRHHQWNGAGQVSVRFQRGLPVRTAFTCRGKRLQIDPVQFYSHRPLQSFWKQISYRKLSSRGIASDCGKGFT